MYDESYSEATVYITRVVLYDNMRYFLVLKTYGEYYALFLLKKDEIFLLEKYETDLLTLKLIQKSI